MIDGEPYDRGEQHGQLLAAEIRHAISTARYLAKWDTGEDFDTFVNARRGAVRAAPRHRIRRRNPGHRRRREAAVLRRARHGRLQGPAAKLVPAHVGAAAAAPWPETLARTARPPMQRVIATGNATRDGRIVMAHNSWDRYAAGDAFNVVFDIVPDGPVPDPDAGAARCISSLTDFRVTSAGLMVTETTISTSPATNASGAPEFYRSRRATQYAKQHWRMVRNVRCRGTNGGYANSWLLGDVKNGRDRALRTRLHFSGFESTKNGFYSGYNTATDLKIRNQECVGEGEDYTDVRKNGARRLRFMQLAEQHHGKIDIDVAKAMIADHHQDVYLDRSDNPCSRTICGHLELDDQRFGRLRSRSIQPVGRERRQGRSTAKWPVTMAFWARWGHPCGLAVRCAGIHAAPSAMELAGTDICATGRPGRGTQFDVPALAHSRPGLPQPVFPTQGQSRRCPRRSTYCHPSFATEPRPFAKDCKTRRRFWAFFVAFCRDVGRIAS